MQRDARLPLVPVHVRYHVGAVDDPPHRRGLAHVVEHFMFEGSRHIDAAASTRRPPPLRATRSTWSRDPGLRRR